MQVPVKNLYEIKDWRGRHLCFQVAATAAEALETARVYYGHASAKIADFIRQD